MIPSDHEQDTVSQVISRDGTAIRYRTSGAGPALVLVHGTSADGTRWLPLLPLLGPQATVHAVDRRGRGLSGDAAAYAMEREYEDVAAVVDAVAADTRGPVDLLGHSYGGCIAMGAATISANVRKLVVYEAPLRSAAAVPPDLIDRLEGLLAEGRHDELLETFFVEVARMSEEEVATLRALPAWQARVDAAHTVVREMRAITEATGLDRARLARLTVPTLLLLGGESPPVAVDDTHLLADTIPGARIAILAGQRHLAMHGDPEAFVTHVLSFLHGEPHGEA